VLHALESFHLSVFKNENQMYVLLQFLKMDSGDLGRHLRRALSPAARGLEPVPVCVTIPLPTLVETSVQGTARILSPVKILLVL